MYTAEKAASRNHGSRKWPGRDRTGDTRIFSPLLYQLSYLAIAVPKSFKSPMPLDDSQWPLLHLGNLNPPVRADFDPLAVDRVQPTSKPPSSNAICTPPSCQPLPSSLCAFPPNNHRHRLINRFNHPQSTLVQRVCRLAKPIRFYW